MTLQHTCQKWYFARIGHFSVDTVESLDFMVTQFSLYLWVYIALPHKFTSSTKTNLARVIFVSETENRRIRKITSQQISKKNKISLECKWVYRMRNVKTACWLTWTDYSASIEAVVFHQRHCSTFRVSSYAGLGHIFCYQGTLNYT